ncbi:MAG: serine/threonine transporter SstT [Synergistaceae bacterium]|nr:serine/threonine transporter SstT [Synergistaceae bacterium]
MQKIIKVYRNYCKSSLILKIAIGMILGGILGIIFPKLTAISILGKVFVGALKGIAPILVFVLVISALLDVADVGITRRFKRLIFLYMLTTFLAAVCAVAASYLFPITLKLSTTVEQAAPGDIATVVENLFTNMVVNPVAALAEANYISILFWAIMLGCALRCFTSKHVVFAVKQISDGVSQLVRWIINCAPFGILGIVFEAVSTNGMVVFWDYGKLICVLVGCMLFVSCVVNPLIVAFCLHKNPYPLYWQCITQSGIPAFFTRSSAANIPINMALCEKLGLDRSFYSLAISLGATINMDGTAITITIMTLATANTFGIVVDFPSAILLSLLATATACGASGITGGSLLLIPVACSLFGISNDVAMQVVAIGFIISVVQDSFETALNSSGDVFLTAASEYRERLLRDEEVKF